MKHVCFVLFTFVYVYGGILSPWVIMPTNVSLGDFKFGGICGYNNILDSIVVVGGKCCMCNNEIISYDFDGSMWNVIQSINYSAGIDGQSYDTYNNAIYYWDDCDPDRSEEIYRFDSSNHARRVVTRLPIDINEDPCIAIDKNDGFLYVIGGQNNMVKVNTTQIYNIDMDIWINDNATRELNVARSRLSCKWSQFNDHIYAVSGEVETGTTDVIEIYDKNINVWNISSVTLNIGRRDLIIIFGEDNYNHLLFIIGGSGNKKTEIFNINTNEIVFGPEFEFNKRSSCVIIRQDILYVIGSDPNMNWFSSNITTMSPTLFPTQYPSNTPTQFPSTVPSLSTNIPTMNTTNPSNSPSQYPSNTPTQFPSNTPSKIPSHNPTTMPTNAPSYTPTSDPTISPSTPTNLPSRHSSMFPSITPTETPTNNPSTKVITNPGTTNNPSLFIIILIISLLAAACIIIILLIIIIKKLAKREERLRKIQLATTSHTSENELKKQSPSSINPIKGNIHPLNTIGITTEGPKLNHKNTYGDDSNDDEDMYDQVTTKDQSPGAV